MLYYLFYLVLLIVLHSSAIIKQVGYIFEVNNTLNFRNVISIGLYLSYILFLIKKIYNWKKWGGFGE